MPKPKPTRKKPDPGSAAREMLEEMDFWVKCAYLFTPMFLALFGGYDAVLAVVFIYPVISVVFFVVRHRYLKSLPPETRPHIVPYSHIYMGRSLSGFILSLTVLSVGYAVYRHFWGG
ncbi:hypothetical protein [Pseudomonas sp. Teo4]|uniref:hypothetical protein n=1 Tax=Pseudomonas sp. Teo4 TaxID=3064528 RepID=UPI002ABB94EB|nr:hypothetical protein [Pseudomonas sp. Teo4]MDZ3991670.1 hypothetical protein [Pseudomonas sp. Teo4]